ncbi:MAG: DUF2007 domain-containing protein [Candidatus Brocadiia bacterium]
MPEGMVTVARYRRVPDAYRARETLRNADIRAEVSQKFRVLKREGQEDEILGMDLYAAEEDAERARELLDDAAVEE